MPIHRFLSTVACGAALALVFPAIEAHAASMAYVVSDSNTGFILDQSNAQKKLQIGSLTKIATAMVVLDWATGSNADLSRQATVPASAVQLGAQTGVGFQPGD